MAESEDNRKYSLFYPTSKNSLFSDYPELKKNKVFRDMNKSQILFVWYYANESSPCFKIEDRRERVKESIKNSFNAGDKRNKLRSSDHEKFLNGNFGKNIDNGIQEMLKYKQSVRMLAKKMVEITLKNYLAIIDVDVNDETFKDKDSEIDFSKKKAYVDAAATIIKNLDGLIEKAEQGFGIVETAEDVGAGLDNEDDSFADLFHEEK